MSASPDDLDRIGRKAAELALGRILRLASRPEQPGDAAEYERCRAIILDHLDPVGYGWSPPGDHDPSWASQRHGAVLRGDD